MMSKRKNKKQRTKFKSTLMSEFNKKIQHKVIPKKNNMEIPMMQIEESVEQEEQLVPKDSAQNIDNRGCLTERPARLRSFSQKKNASLKSSRSSSANLESKIF